MGVKFDFRSVGQPLEADWPVHVQVPVDGGAIETQTFMARLRELTPQEREEEKAASEEYEAFLKENPSVPPARLDPKDRLRKVFIGFGKGEKEEFTPELREELLANDRVYFALLRAWSSFASGVVEKNSSTPSV